MNTTLRPDPRTRLPLKRLLPAAILAMLMPAAAFADEAAVSLDAIDATQLDRVIVTAERQSEYAKGESATGTRLKLTPRETPQSISTVTRAQMDDFALDSVNDVLGATTGVNVEVVETGRTYYTARGFDITNFQRDGFGIPLPYGIQNGDIDTAPFQRVEVLRGANGLASSTGTPSATINFVRKRPTAGFEGSARFTAGSWDKRRIDLDASGPLAGDGAVRGRAVAAWEDGDSYLDRYSHRKHVVYGVVEADLAPATLLTVGASRQRNRADGALWGALPLYYTDGTPTDYDVSTSTAADWAFWVTEDTRAFAELVHAFDNGWALKAAFNYEKSLEDSELFYVYGTPDRETGLGLFAYPSAYDGVFRARTVDAYATGPFTLGGREHELVAGASWAKGRMRELSGYGHGIGTPLSPGEAFDGSYPKPAFDAFYDGSDFTYRRDSVYATVRWNFTDAFKLITGANHARVRSTGVGYGEPKDTSVSRTTPFAGATLDIGGHVSLYASYAEIFAQQVQLDIDGNVLDPVEGRNLEAGLKGEWFDGSLNASLAVFRTTQDNLAEYAGFDPATVRSYYIGRDAESTGYELDVAGNLTPAWQVAGGFTHLDIEDPQGGDARTYVPRNLLRLSTVYRVDAVPGLRVGASVHWQDDIHRVQSLLDPAGNPIVTRQDAYALVGLMVGYRVGAWDATLNIDNLGDEKYIPSLYWEQGFYGAPRSVSLSIGYRF